MFLDLQSLALFGFGVQSPLERTAIALPVPNVPQLRGAAIALQAASLAMTSQTLELSNPLVVVLD